MDARCINCLNFKTQACRKSRFGVCKVLKYPLSANHKIVFDAYSCQAFSPKDVVKPFNK